LAQVFNQKFSYIGKGSQCYAFVSDDQQYVLKFFKFKHLRPNFLIKLLPSTSPFQEFKQRLMERKKRKLLNVFNGYDLAYRENRQYSGLLYIHLVPTQNLQLYVTVIDKIGLERTFNLDEVIFLLQRKGETLRTRLNQVLKQDRLQEAEQAIASILAMYIAEYKKGIIDHDHGVLHNTGFIEDQPFHLDVGHLHQDDQIKQIEVYKQDFKQVIWKINKWMHAYYPHYQPEMSNFLSQEYQRWIGESLDIKSIDPKQFKKVR